MNVALSAIVVFLILLPGFAFRARYRRVERTSLDYAPFGQIVLDGALFAFALHVVWLAIADWGFDRTVHLPSLLGLLSSNPNLQPDAIARIDTQRGWIAAYFISITVFAFVAAQALRAAITRFGLDRLDRRWHAIFRFEAPWYYLLTGQDAAQPPDLVVVSAVVNFGEAPILYLGVLNAFYVNTDGTLDRIVLRDAQRRPFDLALPDRSASADDESFHPIEGDYFVLRYAEIVTLNVRYFRIE